MSSLLRNALLVGTCCVLAGSVAAAQTEDDTPPPAPQAAPTAAPVAQPTATGYQQAVSDADFGYLRTAIAAARSGDGTRARGAMDSLTSPTAKKLALWALTDSAGEQLSFFEIDQARRTLSGWPRPNRRQAVAEKLLETSGYSPSQTIAWFGGEQPQTAQGAMALAAAYRASARQADAKALIQRFWRDELFEADVQRTMLARFGDMLTVDDHIQREDILLYGPQGPAARDLLPLLPPDQQAAAQARMAFRADAANANDVAAQTPAALQASPGFAVEKARYLRKHNLDSLALALVRQFPSSSLHDQGAKLVWGERKQLINAALQAGDYRSAYAAANNTGLRAGTDYTEAEFYAGWLALAKLKDPAEADRHFANIQKVGATPITLGRAFYWRGRAAEARGDKAAAKAFYAQGGQYYTTFYGQLAREKAGLGPITLGRDPAPTAADRARFEGRDLVQSARMLAAIGQRDLFRSFVLTIDDTLPNAEECALLVDLARGYGDQDLGMRVVRACAQRGFVLPERGYPVRVTPTGPEAPEPAIVFGITRQESGFDPGVRSPAGARGMMQLMPATAQSLARRVGVGYSAEMLYDPDYNMKLGATFLGHMINDFSGSYVLAAAAYNAGPGRPATWITYCGDPRTSSTDPADFIECIPFSETRNYVMRVLEATQVYRARLNNGTAPVMLAADLKRGGYVYSGPTPASSQPAAAPASPMGRR